MKTEPIYTMSMYHIVLVFKFLVEREIKVLKNIMFFKKIPYKPKKIKSVLVTETHDLVGCTSLSYFH